MTRGDLIETYKILHGLENVDEHTFFQKTTGNLREHSLKLYHKPVRLDVGKFFFSQKIVDNWNRQPEEAVSASSLSAFKKKLDNFYSLLFTNKYIASFYAICCRVAVWQPALNKTNIHTDIGSKSYGLPNLLTVTVL